MAQSGPIVLVDDDEDDYELFSLVLKKEGITNPLLHFTNGSKALEYLSSTEDRPFLILSDMNMPKMGGIELKTAIDKDDRLRKQAIPFVFFTTSGAEIAVKRAYELNVQGFFVKKDTLESLSDQVKQIYNYWQESLHPNNF
jgi:CheY-like chemotaxis protein